MEARQGGDSYHLGETQTVRRWTLNHAAIALSAIDDDDIVRELLAAVIDADWPLMPAFTLGRIIGALTIAEATTIADLAYGVAARIEAGDPLPLAADTGRIDLAALAA